MSEGFVSNTPSRPSGEEIHATLTRTSDGRIVIEGPELDRIGHLVGAPVRLHIQPLPRPYTAHSADEETPAYPFTAYNDRSASELAREVMGPQLERIERGHP